MPKNDDKPVVRVGDRVFYDEGTEQLPVLAAADVYHVRSGSTGMCDLRIWNHDGSHGTKTSVEMGDGPGKWKHRE